MMVYKIPGFTHTELYNLPIYLRNFYLKEYKDWKAAENKTAENADQAQDQAYQQYQNTHQNPS